MRNSFINDLVYHTDDKTVRDFLVKALKNDNKLLDSFKLTLSKRADEINLSSYRRRIDNIIDSHTDRDDFIDYYHADAFIEDILEFLHSDLTDMISKGYIMESFDLSCYLFKAVSDVEMDDSDGGLTVFGSDMLDIWKELIGKADDAQKNKMFGWFIENLDDYVIDYMEDYIEEIIFSDFPEKCFLDIKLEYADSMINSEKSDWQIKHWILRRIELMEQMDIPEDAFIGYCKKYYDDSSVRKALVNFYLNRNQKETAIELLENELQNYPPKFQAERDIFKQLKDLYQEIGDTAQYQKYLWLLVTKHCTLDFYRELKSLYSADEWQTVRKKVLASNNGYILMQLLNEEMLYDRLMIEIEKENSLYYLHEYKSVLADRFPDRVLKVYKNALVTEAMRTAKRSDYTRWASELNAMLEINGGDAVVREIVVDWRKRYKNRPAMMQELNAVKV